MKCLGDVARAGGVRVEMGEKKLRIEVQVIRVMRVRAGVRVGRWDPSDSCPEP